MLICLERLTLCVISAWERDFYLTKEYLAYFSFSEFQVALLVWSGSEVRENGSFCKCFLTVRPCSSAVGIGQHLRVQSQSKIALPPPSFAGDSKPWRGWRICDPSLDKVQGLEPGVTKGTWGHGPERSLQPKFPGCETACLDFITCEIGMRHIGKEQGLLRGE